MRLRATILGVCCLALVGPTAAEAPLADRLPGQCLMYAGWAGRNLPLDGSTFGQLLRDPAVGNVLNALYQAAHKASPPPTRATLQSSWSLAKIAWQHPIAVSLMDIRPGQPKATISATVLVDLGKDKAAFAKHLDAILLNIGVAPIRNFMLKQVREKDLGLFVNLSGIQKPETVEDIPTHVIVPAFIISELRTAFQIGFMIYVPFLVLDMVIASVLMSMGMLMLPPIMISLPFKLMLFVLVDGWHLIVGSLVKSFY